MLLACLLIFQAGVGHAAERVALILGNGAYRNAPPLANASADGRSIAEVLRRLGFEVFEGIDLDNAATGRLIHSSPVRSTTRGWLCSFTPATACRSLARTTWCPVDAQLKHESDLEFETVPLRRIMSQLERSDRTNIVMVDACRDNPFLRRVANAASRRLPEAAWRPCKAASAR